MVQDSDKDFPASSFDDDEIVIVAGAQRISDEGGRDSISGSDTEAEPAEEDIRTDIEEPAEEHVGAEDETSVDREGAQHATNGEGDYDDVIQNDLEDLPAMSNTQKIVIIGAVLMIIIAVVYYLVVLR